MYTETMAFRGDLESLILGVLQHGPHFIRRDGLGFGRQRRRHHVVPGASLPPVRVNHRVDRPQDTTFGHNTCPDAPANPRCRAPARSNFTKGSVIRALARPE